MSQIPSSPPEPTVPLTPPDPTTPDLTPIPETLPLAEQDLQALDDIFTGVDTDTDGMETIILFQ